MISKILFRLGVAWLAIILILYFLILGTGGNPQLYIYGALAIPGFLAFVLSWVLLPLGKD